MSANPRYYPELDGLRACAALIVMVFHLKQAGIPIPGPVTFGQTGVDLFFVLSGFLITSILLRAERGDWNEVKIFYIRRSLRIFPLYFGYLILFSLLIGPPGWQFWVYMQNFAFAWGNAIVGPTHFWSLAVEEQFYLVWPFLVLFLPRNRLVPALLALICFSAVLRFQLVSRGIEIFYFTLTRLDGLAAGAILAVANNRSMIEAHRRSLQAGIVVFGVLMIGIGMAFKGEDLAWFATAKYMLVTGFYTCVIATQVIGSSSLASRCFRARWLRFVGRISYGLYVFHPAVFAFCVKHLAGFPIWIQALAGILGAFIISVASWYCFERHLIKLKDRWVPEARSAPRALVEV